MDCERRARAVGVLAFAIAASAGPACKQASLADASCPPSGTKLTYENFGAQFFGERCQPCHGAPNDGRNGAPDAFDFGTLDQIHAHADRIYARAAVDDATMPPGPDLPPKALRDELGEWLACGAPP